MQTCRNVPQLPIDRPEPRVLPQFIRRDDPAPDIARVLPEHQGAGLGQRLYKRALAQALAPNKEELSS